MSSHEDPPVELHSNPEIADFSQEVFDQLSEYKTVATLDAFGDLIPNPEFYTAVNRAFGPMCKIIETTPEGQVKTVLFSTGLTGKEMLDKEKIKLRFADFEIVSKALEEIGVIPVKVETYTVDIANFASLSLLGHLGDTKTTLGNYGASIVRTNVANLEVIANRVSKVLGLNVSLFSKVEEIPGKLYNALQMIKSQKSRKHQEG